MQFSVDVQVTLKHTLIFWKEKDKKQLGTETLRFLWLRGHAEGGEGAAHPGTQMSCHWTEEISRQISTLDNNLNIQNWNVQNVKYINEQNIENKPNFFKFRKFSIFLLSFPFENYYRKVPKLTNCSVSGGRYFRVTKMCTLHRWNEIYNWIVTNMKHTHNFFLSRSAF